MSFPLSDPLEGIATRPADVQVALIVAAVQDIRGKVVEIKSEFKSELAELKTELAATKRALYTVALSVTGSALLFAITIAFTFRK